MKIEKGNEIYDNGFSKSERKIRLCTEQAEELLEGYRRGDPDVVKEGRWITYRKKTCYLSEERRRPGLRPIKKKDASSARGIIYTDKKRRTKFHWGLLEFPYWKDEFFLSDDWFKDRIERVCEERKRVEQELQQARQNCQSDTEYKGLADYLYHLETHLMSLHIDLFMFQDALAKGDIRTIVASAFQIGADSERAEIYRTTPVVRGRAGTKAGAKRPSEEEKKKRRLILVRYSEFKSKNPKASIRSASAWMAKQEDFIASYGESRAETIRKALSTLLKKMGNQS